MINAELFYQPSDRFSKVSFGGLENIIEIENDSPRHTASFNDTMSNRSSVSVLNMGAVHHLASVSEFKRGIENEKNLSQFILHYDHLLSQPRGNRSTENAIALLERSYKLQIDSLLEEVHQLKLKQKILEKKLENSNTGSENSGKTRSKKCQNESCKLTLEAKNSIISELEFQIQQLKSEISYLRSANDLQKAKLEKINQDISQIGTLRSQVEEYQDEIGLLKQRLAVEETKNNRINQDLQQSRAANKSFLQNSLQSANRGFISQNQSMVSIPEVRSSSPDLLSFRQNIRFLELNQSSYKELTLTPSNSIKSQSPTLPNQLRRESQDIISTNTSFSRVLNAAGTSLRTLNNYERALLRELEINPNSADKIKARLVELRKIKGFYLQEENKKLMTMINKQGHRENSTERSIYKIKILSEIDIDSEKSSIKQNSRENRD